MGSLNLEEEIEGSAQDIESKLGLRPRGFAYPYGNVNETSEAVVGAHYTWACTTELAVVSPEDTPHRLPRLDAFYYRRPGQLEAWGTASFRARLSMRRAARDARSWLAGRGTK
jgi:peptidoglycan/xylan/chitin deacetylase (PgdA/CDA1 family)